MQHVHGQIVDTHGELVVPSGRSYMTWADMDAGSGWHGPCYVHVLDRPFRLYQLSEFSVVGELIQGANRMGKTYVALYDENMRRVMMVLFGDSWSGSEKGYFNVYFYPQDSSSAYRSSGYIYSSFKKTAKLWWGQSEGGHGAVYASIDGQSDGYPIAECDNASRVIKYVAILGYRYSSYSLVSMRIHDINVVADLNKHNPTAPNPDEPVECDGSGTPTTAEIHRADYDLSNAIAQVICYWTGPWPLFHVEISQPIPHPDGQLVANVHTAKNLLGVTEYSACSVAGDDATPTPNFDVGMWSFLIENVFSIPLILTLQFSCAYVESVVRSGAAANPLLAVAAGAVMASAALTAYLAPVLYTLYLVENHIWSNEDAFWFLFACGWNYVQVGFAVIAGTIATSIITKLYGAQVQAIKNFLSDALARFDPVAKLLRFSWLANIVITGIGLALWATAYLDYAYW
ncbi:MAG: hypothetical protein DRO73_11250 [Candidatus Thorarchaeota archaeon]|nr:MAG: hypothetical protein DRO73_11250 [Candidatus Thorarchaeota archaeon]